MIKFKKHITLLTCLSVITCVFAQETQETDTLNTQVVNVVKPYKPSISDAFKVKEIPIHFKDREHGQSKMNIGIFREAFIGVLKLRSKKFEN